MAKIKNSKVGVYLAVIAAFGAGYYFMKRKKEPVINPIPDVKDEVDEYIVNTMTTSLNVREKPDATSKIVGSLMKGSKFRGQKSESPLWIKVLDASGRVQGYVSAQYARLFTAPNPTTGGGAPNTQTTPGSGVVLPGGPSNPPSAQKGKIKIKTAGGNLNVRESNSATSKIISQVKNGDVLDADTSGVGFGPWIKVTLPSGLKGWVSTQYVIYL